MNRQEHIGSAVILTIPILYLFYKLNMVDNVYYIIPMYFGVVFPDILEPAYKYTHRKYYHSREILKVISIFTLCLFLVALIFNWFFYVFFFGVGYILHLLADSTTPMGLPRN